MTDAVKTQEQLDQEAIAYAEQQSVSARFRLKHQFKASKKNADLIVKYLDGKSWTLDNLDVAYAAALAAEGADAFDKNPVYVPPVVTPEVKTEPELPYWGKLATRRDIDAIPRPQYRAWLKDPKFEAAVNAVLRGAR